MPEQQWILIQSEEPPESFLQLVKKYNPNSDGRYAAQLLWQRGIREESAIAAFINPKIYKPASAFEFGSEMDKAVQRLRLARDLGEKVCIWGDFDADGITSTSLLWDGLGQFFSQNTQLIYYIPNRLNESHGLNNQGIDKLAMQGCKLIVTCDTGSTNISEIIYAKQLGIDVIVTDHHTLPGDRPPVKAIVNPRYLPATHPLYHLSGVAVAYQLVSALYKSFPLIPQQPLEDLLDLVAVGLIADLVQLSGDCRYLAQLGIQKLQQDFKQPPTARRRPGVGRLLELCQRNGDRPTDISFGLGPRINAVSRIQGDASFCVELLTSRDVKRCNELAEITELANSRRKSLQKDISSHVAEKLSQIDLSTTSVIVLEDSQWAVGVLGLVAGQVAQETGKPTILLSTEGNGEWGVGNGEWGVGNGEWGVGNGEWEIKEKGDNKVKDSSSPTTHSPLPTPPLARGSARSVNSVDLYQLVSDLAHLLHRFGGHPFAAGLSLPVENIPLFTEAINQKLRLSLGGTLQQPTVQADLVVKVADLGEELFKEMKLLEPCGMGNPVPKLLIQNCCFENAWHQNQKDAKGKKIQYIKTDFDIRDNSTNSRFPGVWWGHYKDELPIGTCDCIAELDYNTFKKRYEIRLVDVRSSVGVPKTLSSEFILDWRNSISHSPLPTPHSPLLIQDCPTSWNELRVWFKRSLTHNQPLALAWSKPEHESPSEVWLKLVGLAKYLSRTSQPVRRIQLLEKLNVSDQSLDLGFKALKSFGFTIKQVDRSFVFSSIASDVTRDATCHVSTQSAIAQFLAAVREEQFQQKYFAEVPLPTVKAFASKVLVDRY